MGIDETGVLQIEGEGDADGNDTNDGNSKSVALLEAVSDSRSIAEGEEGRKEDTKRRESSCSTVFPN